MKTKKYPIKEMVRFEMDENKIWWLKYNKRHECFPERYKEVMRLNVWETGYEIEEIQNLKEYKDFLQQTTKFCYSNDFILENGQSNMVSWHHKDLSWSKKQVLSYTLPELIFPKVILEVDYPPHCRDSFLMVDFVGTPNPYYGNPHYKKYIEDNNGEYPLPLPKDVDWIQTRWGDGKKYYIYGGIVT